MKITIDKTSLLKVLDRCKSVTEAKGPMPILSHVKLSANVDELHGCLTVTATDLFIGISGKVSCSVDQGGSICVNARDLYDRFKLMPDGDVKVTVDGTKVTVKASKSPRKFVLSGLPADEYPTMAEIHPNSAPITINDREFADDIQATIYAVSNDESRTHLNSICIQESNGNMNFVATDGHRLALLKNTKFNDSGSSQWLVPLKAAKELLKLCVESAGNKGSDHNVTIYPDTSTVFVIVNGFTYYFKLADGMFPPYNQILPKKWRHEVKVNAKKLQESFKALAVATGQSKGVLVTLQNNVLKLDVKSLEGEGNDEVECVYEATGKENDGYGVNAVYIADALGPINTDNAVLCFNDDLDPILVTEDSVQDSVKEKYISIVMPMRL